MGTLQKHSVYKYVTWSDVQYEKLDITYEIFGREIHTAPIIVVFHALTGNSNVAGEEKGWWKELIGKDKAVDLNRFTVISFNILGNGYDGELIENYRDFCGKDVAILSFHTLRSLKVKEIYAAIGGSLGGGIAWELVAEFPKFSKYLIAVATDWKATDWVQGFCGIQENILNHSDEALQDARKMAMMFYRTADSLTQKFHRRKQADGQFEINSWLNHHGVKLESRFTKEAYLMMNHLMRTVDISRGQYTEEVFQHIHTKIIQISINTDLLYLPEENRNTSRLLDRLGIENYLYEIESSDGHDAFLIESDKIGELLTPHLSDEVGEKLTCPVVSSF